jgi:hypothetical protein
VTRTPAGRAESETSLTELLAVDMLALGMLALDMGLFPLSMVLGRMTVQT